MAGNFRSSLNGLRLSPSLSCLSLEAFVMGGERVPVSGRLATKQISLLWWLSKTMTALGRLATCSEFLVLGYEASLPIKKKPATRNPY